jgi:hypothetical protein
MPRVRHVPRILLNALTALSLILCAATVALWVRSYWIADVIERRERQIQVDGERGWTFLRLVSQRGKLRGTTVRHFDEVTYPANGPTGPIWSWSHDVRRRVGLYTEHGVYDQTRWNRAGIIFVKPVGYLGTQVLSVRIIGVPYWLLAGVLCIAPVVGAIRIARRSRKALTGLCPA